MLPTDFQAAKPKRAAPSQREVGVISAGRPARWSGTVCCGDSERGPQFPSSQSSESHAQNTTPRVIRQATDGSEPQIGPDVTSFLCELHSCSSVESLPRTLKPGLVGESCWHRLSHGMRCKKKSRTGHQSDSHVFQRVSALPESSHSV